MWITVKPEEWAFENYLKADEESRERLMFSEPDPDESAELLYALQKQLVRQVESIKRGVAAGIFPVGTDFTNITLGQITDACSRRDYRDILLNIKNEEGAVDLAVKSKKPPLYSTIDSITKEQKDEALREWFKRR